MSHTIDLCVPDIGDYTDVPVIEVLVAVGDRVDIDTPLLTLESDKATMDVPADAAGTVTDVLVKVGDRVSQGSVFLRLSAEAVKNTASTALAPAATDGGLKPALQTTDAAPHASRAFPVGTASSGPPTLPPLGVPHGPCGPSVRRLARELGVDLSRVTGSGPKGRLMKEDITAYIKHSLQAPRTQATTPASQGSGLDLLPWPTVDFEKFGPIERRPKSRIQKISGQNLHRNWVMIPHVTNFDEADITDIEAFRQQINAEQAKDGAKVTMLAFLIKAAVHTLKAYPAFNCSLDGEDIVQKGYWHIGFAADTPNGLVVPVIRNADQKRVLDIARESSDLARLAREGKLKPDQMQGGCFTVSSLGGIGGTGFTPIINAPEVAILGVTRASMKPVWDGEAFQPRLILPLCLSWDHRAVDGAAAARFLVHLSALLADFRRAML